MKKQQHRRNEKEKKKIKVQFRTSATFSRSCTDDISVFFVVFSSFFFFHYFFSVCSLRRSNETFCRAVRFRLCFISIFFFLDLLFAKHTKYVSSILLSVKTQTVQRVFCFCRLSMCNDETAHTRTRRSKWTNFVRWKKKRESQRMSNKNRYQIVEFVFVAVILFRQQIFYVIMQDELICLTKQWAQPTKPIEQFHSCSYESNKT